MVNGTYSFTLAKVGLPEEGEERLYILRELFTPQPPATERAMDEMPLNVSAISSIDCSPALKVTLWSGKQLFEEGRKGG